MESSALENAESWISFFWWFKLGAAALVAVGVGMEFGGDWLSRPFEKTIENAQKLELAELHKQSDDAKLETARLSKEAETARAAIAEANARAVEARLALEKFKAPRTLDADAKARVKAVVEKFPGTPFDVMVNRETEPQNFATEVGKLLESAGWVWMGRNNTPGLQFGVGGHQAGMMTVFTGFAFEIDVSKQADWEQRLLVVANAMRAEGFNVRVNVANDKSASPDAIHLYFGTKN
jgi:hypothetical protein